MKIFIFSCFLSWGCLSAQVTFTEVLYDPSTNEFHDEFIEIYNHSDQQLDLNGWQLSDSLSFDQLSDAGFGMILNARQYAVILDGSYFGESETYDKIIPDSALIITIADNGFGRSGLTNSEPRRLSLIDSSGNSIDEYRYSIGNTPGYSDEKIILNTNNSPENWAQSLTEGGTPGQRNSVAPFPSDLALPVNAFSWKPSANVVTNQTVYFELTLTNPGISDFSGEISLKLFIDNSRDSLFNGNDELIFSNQGNLNLAQGAKTNFSFEHEFVQSGTFFLVAIIESIADNNALNNKAYAQITVLDNSTALHINEIKFLAADNEPEWLEIYNAGQESVALSGWGIADQRDTAFVDTSVFIQPGQYKIIAADAGLDSLYDVQDSSIIILNDLPTFNNSADIIFLLNPLGGWLEQVPYDVSWLEGEEDRLPSLERINTKLDARLARNWGPSVDVRSATPGRANSIFTSPQSELSSALNVSPNPFSPDADGFEDHTIISLRLPVNTARVKVQIFDILGRTVRTIRDNSFSASQSDLIWDGRDDKGRLVRMGIYIVHSQILNDREGVIREEKTSVVVAGKL